MVGSRSTNSSGQKAAAGMPDGYTLAARPMGVGPGIVSNLAPQTGPSTAKSRLAIDRSPGQACPSTIAPGQPGRAGVGNPQVRLSQGWRPPLCCFTRSLFSLWWRQQQGQGGSAMTSHGHVVFSRMDEVLFGVPAAQAVVTLARRYGAERVFLMASGTLNQQTNAIEEIQTALGRACAAVYSRMVPHTPRKAVIDATEMARTVAADLIVT